MYKQNASANGVLCDCQTGGGNRRRANRRPIRTAERPDGTAEVEIRLAAAAYGSLDARLETELKRAKITVAGKTSG
ncbi:MAG: hypothetical protein ACXWC8_22165, partial [Limisphaerales bacterium]